MTKLGWLDPVNWNKLPKNVTAEDTWNYLADNMQSKYLQIDKENFWCHNWSLAKRRKNRKEVLATLNRKKIDLMLTMGIWAGQDLANRLHNTPTMYLESSFPIAKKLYKNAEVPEHLYLPRYPEFLLRQVRLFQKLTKFKTLGVVYVASSEGRHRASLSLLKHLSQQGKFKLISVRILPRKELKSERLLEEYIEAHEKIAPKVDAMWVTTGFVNNPDTAAKVLAPFFKYKVPTWSPHSRQGVRHGILFGVIVTPRKWAEHHAHAAAKILNGAKPVNQAVDMPVDNQLVINCAAASKIDFKIPKNLLAVAKESYLGITGRNK
jgi:ABC-type uncharacterized transport system substrate-binding protein